MKIRETVLTCALAAAIAAVFLLLDGRFELFKER